MRGDGRRDRAAYHGGRRGAGEAVGRALDGTAAAVEDVGVDHSGTDVAVAEQLLDGANVVAGFE